MTTKLIKLYQHILHYCHYEVDKQGRICRYGDEDKLIPIEVEGKQIFLPTVDNMQRFDGDTMMIFHPIVEHLNRGESDILRRIRNAINLRVNSVTIAIGTGLLQLVANKAEHKALSPEQREILLCISDADKNTSSNFLNFIAKHYGERYTTMFSNIYLRRGGTYKGEKHSCVGVVTFPFYEFLRSDDVAKDIARKADRKAFEDVVKFIFPESDSEAEAYNDYSDSLDAPKLIALLKTALNLTSRLDYLLDLFGDYIEDAETSIFGDSWLEQLEDLDPLRSEIRMIPSQRGNDGRSEKDEEVLPTVRTVEPARPVPASHAAPAVGVQRPVAVDRRAPQPEYVQPQGPQVNERGEVSFFDIIGNNPAVGQQVMAAATALDYLNYRDPRQPAGMVNLNRSMVGGGNLLPPGGAGHYPVTGTSIYRTGGGGGGRGGNYNF